MKFSYYIASTALTLLLATSCSDSDNWTPGPEDTDKGVWAYFTKPASSSFIFSSDMPTKDMAITVPVYRQKTEGEATVGIVLTSETEGFSSQPTVTFAAGEAETSVTIDCSGIPNGTMSSVTISLAADQTNIYGEGLYQLTFSAIKSDWKLLSDNVRYLYSDFNRNPIYPATYAELYQLEGTMKFKFTDFFGSGLDMWFECTTPDATTLYPLLNANFEDVADEDKEVLGWYLYDEATTTWPTWVPGNAEGYPAITYLLFYSDSTYNLCNMIYDKEDLYGYIGLTTGVSMDNGNFAWGDFQVDFNLLYNPFE